MEDNDYLLSPKEKAATKDSLNAKTKLMPKLLMKDHKQKKPDGKCPTRLVVLETNFAATHSKIDYLVIKRVFERNEVNINKHTIQQSL